VETFFVVYRGMELKGYFG